jgi:hypothetical protein
MIAGQKPLGRLRWLRVALLPNCREMTRRSSLAADRPLTLPERLGALLHLALCQLCRRYRRQLAWLRHTAPEQHRRRPRAAESIRPHPFEAPPAR